MPTTNIHGVYVNGTTYPIYDERFGTSSTPTVDNDKVDQIITSTNANYPIAFAYPTIGITTSVVNDAIRRDNSFNYNPSTKLLTTGALGVSLNIGYTSVVPTTTTGYSEGQVMFVIFDE